MPYATGSRIVQGPVLALALKNLSVRSELMRASSFTASTAELMELKRKASSAKGTRLTPLPKHNHGREMSGTATVQSPSFSRSPQSRSETTSAFVTATTTAGGPPLLNRRPPPTRPLGKRPIAMARAAPLRVTPPKTAPPPPEGRRPGSSGTLPGKAAARVQPPTLSPPAGGAACQSSDQSIARRVAELSPPKPRPACSSVPKKATDATLSNSSQAATSAAPPPSPKCTNYTVETEPYAPHDMDMAYFADPSHWNRKLSAEAAHLLSGRGLEAPYTTALWVQAYEDPMAFVADIHCDPPHTVGAPSATSPLLLKAPHIYKEKITTGYYACVRCGTPVCGPSYQTWHPAYPGMAIFTHVHAGGLRVEVSAEALPARNAHVRFHVFCTNCHGCLGGLSLESIPMTAAPIKMKMPHVDAISAGGARQGRHTLNSQPHPVNDLDVHEGESTSSVVELFIANSACLCYVKYRTQAALDGFLVDACGMSEDVAEVADGGGGFLHSLARSTVGADGWGLDFCDDDGYFDENSDASTEPDAERW